MAVLMSVCAGAQLAEWKQQLDRLGRPWEEIATPGEPAQQVCLLLHVCHQARAQSSAKLQSVEAPACVLLCLQAPAAARQQSWRLHSSQKAMVSGVLCAGC